MKAETPREASFYHLERSSPDDALAELLEKTLARGWRALVRTTDPERLAHLDDWLWTWRDEAFLAHGRFDDAAAARLPILLTTAEENLNAAQALFILDEPPSRVADYERCVVLFEGADVAALNRARALWTRYKAAGSPVTYWKQKETGGWAKQA